MKGASGLLLAATGDRPVLRHLFWAGRSHLVKRYSSVFPFRVGRDGRADVQLDNADGGIEPAGFVNRVRGAAYAASIRGRRP